MEGACSDRRSVQCRESARTDRGAAVRLCRRARAEPVSARLVSFDVAEALDDPTVFVATEVFEDAAAREKQEALPEVGAVMALLKGGALAAPPDMAVYEGVPVS